MPFPVHILANADDFGLNESVNKAILLCYQRAYINSSSILTTTSGFEQAAEMVQQHSCIINLGVHINMAEGLPLTNVDPFFTTANGSWDINKTSKILNTLTRAQKTSLFNELCAQVNKALLHGLPLQHIDSHYHLHTLPALSGLFLHAAKKFNLKLRLAQTYREGSYLKFWYRQYLNSRIRASQLNYSDRFETVGYFMRRRHKKGPQELIEVMLHPAFDKVGSLSDHYDSTTMLNWIAYLDEFAATQS